MIYQLGDMLPRSRPQHEITVLESVFTAYVSRDICSHVNV